MVQGNAGPVLPVFPPNDQEKQEISSIFQCWQLNILKTIYYDQVIVLCYIYDLGQVSQYLLASVSSKRTKIRIYSDPDLRTLYKLLHLILPIL